MRQHCYFNCLNLSCPFRVGRLLYFMRKRPTLRHCRRARRETANRRKTLFDEDLCVRDKKVARVSRTTINIRTAYIIGKSRELRNILLCAFFIYKFRANCGRMRKGGRNPLGEEATRAKIALFTSRRGNFLSFEILSGSLRESC